MQVYSIDRIPKFGELVHAQPGRNRDVVAWIGVTDNDHGEQYCGESRGSIEVHCDDYSMFYTWDNERIYVVHICDDNENIENIFDAAIMKNSRLKFGDDAEKNINYIKDNFNIETASVILSDLVYDLNAYFTFFHDGVEKGNSD